MKTAVFIVCLIGMACAFPSSSESRSKSSSESHPDSASSSSEEKTRPTPTVNGPTVTTSNDTINDARGDSVRRRRALTESAESSLQDTNSIESHSTSRSDSHPDSSSEEVSIAPTPNEATPQQTMDNSLRRRRALDQIAHGSSSHHSEESATTESTSHQSQPSESSEEDSHEHSTKMNLLQGILGTTTADPDTSEESSEERTTPAFQP